MIYYDRNIMGHKRMLVMLLDKVSPGWRNIQEKRDLCRRLSEDVSENRPFYFLTEEGLEPKFEEYFSCALNPGTILNYLGD